jgi:hypothetical protein
MDGGIWMGRIFRAGWTMNWHIESYVVGQGTGPMLTIEWTVSRLKSWEVGGQWTEWRANWLSVAGWWVPEMLADSGLGGMLRAVWTMNSRDVESCVDDELAECWELCGRCIRGMLRAVWTMNSRDVERCVDDELAECWELDRYWITGMLKV